MCDMNDEVSGMDSVIYLLKSQKESLSVKFDVAFKVLDVFANYIKGVENKDILSKRLLNDNKTITV